MSGDLDNVTHFPSPLPAPTTMTARPRYRLGHEALRKRRLHRLAAAALRFEQAHVEAVKAKRELPRRAPERAAALRARLEARASLLFHVRELRREKVAEYAARAARQAEVDARRAETAPGGAS